MKPKSIGIIGGAGPMAGVFLLEKIFHLARELHGCWEDADFPKVTLLSFPFSDMLSKEIKASSVREELQSCLESLRKNGAETLGIACNTLHAFLDPQEERKKDLLQLPKLVAQTIGNSSPPLILGTTTSAHFQVYGKRFPCIYPDAKTQERVDEIIIQILKGEPALEQLQKLIAKHPSQIVILACTELSLYARDLHVEGKTIIDPLHLLAKQLIQTSFGK